MDNLEQIKKAVEIEVKYKYININGKTRSFASFICSELKKDIKVSDDIDNNWIVEDGLNATDTIVVSGIQNVAAEGQKLKTTRIQSEEK